MKITLEMLTILEALERYGSFAAAGDALFKTPAAISYMVRKMEDRLDIQILDRSGYRTQFTADGQSILEHGREILKSARELENMVSGVIPGRDHRLVLSVSELIPNEILMPLVSAFLEQHPQTELTLRHHQLIKKQCNLTPPDIFIHCGEHFENTSDYKLNHLCFMEQEFVVSGAHPLSRMNKKDIHYNLDLYRYICLSTDSLYQRASEHSPLSEKLIVHDIAAKKMAIQYGMGWGILSDAEVRAGENKGILSRLQLGIDLPSLPVTLGWHKNYKGTGSDWWRIALTSSALACYGDNPYPYFMDNTVIIPRDSGKSP